MKPLKEKTTASENDSLVDRVEKHIIEYIKENALKAGDALPKELEFAETLGVSRTAIREAMLRLRTLGLVESFWSLIWYTILKRCSTQLW